MHRRSYLAGAITVVAGCTGDEGSGQKTTTLPPLPESVERIVRVGRVDTIPDRYDTGATVEVVEPRVTTEHTAHLRVTVENTGDERYEYHFDPQPPMGHERSSEGPGTLLLAEAGTQERGASDCWRPAAGGHGDGIARVELEPDEAIQNTLELWDVGDRECLPTGEYTFRAGIPRFDDRDVETTWSFTLELTKP